MKFLSTDTSPLAEEAVSLPDISFYRFHSENYHVLGNLKIIAHSEKDPNHSLSVILRSCLETLWKLWGLRLSINPAWDV